mmetsp:Transcript_59091/g.129757  ORF Transcript_59091/g.129757 Transcript_59091/m.129757 type:complete len:358 (-) Transcript_59091:358-1431(-)
MAMAPAKTTGTSGEKVMPSGWIDTTLCEAVLTKDLRWFLALDGSASSMTGLHYLADHILQIDKTAYLLVFHVYDEAKTYLPVSCQKDALYTTTDATLTGSVSSKRYRLHWVSKKSSGSTGHQICEAIQGLPADYVVMGFHGLKGRKDYYDVLGGKISTNVSIAMAQGNSSSLVCIKDEEVAKMPFGRKAVWVVSANLNKSSMKAVLDALRLSKPGDEIHAVYVKGFMEWEDSDYTLEVRKRFESFFKTFEEAEAQDVFSKFRDRKMQFAFVPKQKRETTADSVVRYADEVEADWIVVGANAADRVARGKKPVGTVSLQICLQFDRNFVVSNWIDVSSRIYDQYIARTNSDPPAVAGA